MISVQNAIQRSDVLLGIVRAEPIKIDANISGFEHKLSDLLEKRRAPLDPDEEVRRTAVRDMLRNGRYKPTGRSKPASEYLLRAAENGFPRINAPVDICNYISLKYLVPISLWDLDLAGTTLFTFRLGQSGEAYVFNTGGQVIELEDLIVGYRVTAGVGEPIVNPVKDSLATKTTDQTRRVAACVYTPEGPFSREGLSRIWAEFSELLAAVSGGESVFGVAGCNETISV